jgi:hypothetical protein
VKAIRAPFGDHWGRERAQTRRPDLVQAGSVGVHHDGTACLPRSLPERCDQGPDLPPQHLALSCKPSPDTTRGQARVTCLLAEPPDRARPFGRTPAGPLCSLPDRVRRRSRHVRLGRTPRSWRGRSLESRHGRESGRTFDESGAKLPALRRLASTRPFAPIAHAPKPESPWSG